MPALIPIHNTWGAVLIGVFLGILYGILTLQTFTYYQKYPKDRSYLKSLVALIWFLDTLHTVFVTHMVYTYLVTGFGDYPALENNIWSFNLHVLVTSLVACISQVFFVIRCWRLDKGKFNTVLSAIILLIAVVQVSFGLTCTALTFTLTQFKQFLRYTWAVDTWLGSAAACDILVSLAIVRSLWRSRTGIARTNNLIRGLIMWTVNTGVVTSVWAILDIALFTASTDTLIHDFFNVMLAKLYANTLLATLNHRRPSNTEDDAYTKSISLSAVGGRPGRNYTGRDAVTAGVDSKLSGVHVVTHTIHDVDNKHAGSDTVYLRDDDHDHHEGSWSPGAEGDGDRKTARRWVESPSPPQ